MIRLIPTLLEPRRRTAFLDELVRDVHLGERLLAMVTVMAAGAALYGAVLGSWRGGAQIVYAAVKLPLVLILTSALTLLLNWMTSILLDLNLRFVQVAALTFLVLAAAALVLASLAPVAWLFTVSAPPPSPEARITHNLLYLFHTGAVALAGLAGAAILWRTLVGLAGDRARARHIQMAWLLAFGLVGGQVAWLLRPFVGSVYHPMVFLRSESFERNVYEFILRDILPHLLGACGVPSGN